MASRFQLRRDISTIWTENNPILAQGEPGWEIDTNKIKYGNGFEAWNALGYSNQVVGAFDTDDITEATNLYWTVPRGNAMFDARLVTSDTGSLPEGSNLYYTEARANSSIDARIPSTTALIEGTNLYYTEARANNAIDTRLSGKSTTDLTEGTNLYYTDTRANTAFDTRLASKTTTNLAEGTNQYFSDARVLTAVVDGVIVLKDIKETVVALSGTTPEFNVTTGTMLTWTLTAHSTPTDGLANGESVLLTIDDGTTYTITWPSVTWKTGSGVAPALQTTGVTSIVLWKVGGVLYGARVGDA